MPRQGFEFRKQPILIVRRASGPGPGSSGTSGRASGHPGAGGLGGSGSEGRGGRGVGAGAGSGKGGGGALGRWFGGTIESRALKCFDPLLAVDQPDGGILAVVPARADSFRRCLLRVLATSLVSHPVLASGTR